MKQKSLFLFFCIQVLVVSSNCQTQKNLFLSKVTKSNGLSASYITKIVRDSYGFFWIGTQEGLNRYDGKDFIGFTPESDDKHRIGSSYISDMVEDRKKGLLYVLTSYGNVDIIDIKTCFIVKRIIKDEKQQNLSEKWLRCLCLQENILWIGTAKGFFAYNLNSDKYEQIKLKSIQKVEDFNVSKICCDNSGRVWVLCDYFGILLINGGFNIVDMYAPSLAKHEGAKDKDILIFWDVSISKHVLYAATSLGLFCFAANKNGIEHLSFQSNTLLDSSEILSICFSAPQVLWFSANNNFYSYDLKSGELVNFHEENKDDDWCSYVYQIYYNAEDQKIWLGTQAGVASFPLKQQPFESFYRSKTLLEKIKHAYSLLPINDSIVYCGDENGLFSVNTQTREIFKIDTASVSLVIFKGKLQHIFVSNRKGFYTLENNHLKNADLAFNVLKPLRKDQLNSAIQFNDSLVIFSSFIQKGLYVWNTKSQTLKNFGDNSLNRINNLTIINNIYKSGRLSLFILTEKSIIEFNPITYAYRSYTIHKDNAQSVYNNYMDMCETNDGYWIATYGNGLLHTDKDFNIKHVYSTNNGLCDNCIYRVFANGAEQIIATTNNGLGIITKNGDFIKSYYQSDGLHASEFEQYCANERNGHIYAGGVNGFTIIEPKYFTTNPTPPKFFFTKIKIQTTGQTLDTSNLEITNLKIPSNWLQTNISFIGLNYSNPERVIYQYRIKERSSKWSEPSTQNFVTLMGLSPGTYTLEVKAANEDGVWCAPKTLTLTFLPKWYQTLWFDFAVALTVIGILYAFYRYRMRQLRKQHEIRVSIASDLHDDIGSALNTVKVFTHLAKRDTEKEGHLNQIEESLTQATIGLRDMLWILDDTQDTLHEIMERIKKFALPVASANGINLECVTETEEGEGWVNKTKKRNLLLIAKESINNSIKYAQCQNIKVLLRQKKNKITLIIKDDGTGFNTNAAAQGYGLKNIKNRAEQMGCTAEIISIEGEGTEVRVVSKS